MATVYRRSDPCDAFNGSEIVIPCFYFATLSEASFNLFLLLGYSSSIVRDQWSNNGRQNPLEKFLGLTNISKGLANTRDEIAFPCATHSFNNSNNNNLKWSSPSRPTTKQQEVAINLI